jgi:hypothetical protein
MTTTEIVIIITTIVAVGGLCLSIYKLYLERRDKRTLLRSKISFGFPANKTNTLDWNDVYLSLEVLNPSEKLVRVSQAEILYGKERILIIHSLGTHQLPFELPSGQSASIFVPANEFAMLLKAKGYRGEVKIRANFRDAIGNNYQSKKFAIDVNNWPEQQ